MDILLALAILVILVWIFHSLVVAVIYLIAAAFVVWIFRQANNRRL